MVRRLLFLVALAAILPFSAYAQEIPTKISDFNYGNSGQDIILDIDVVDGKLYGIFSSLLGEQSNGLISELNNTSGVGTPLLDPQQTAWIGGEASTVSQNIFSINDTQLALVTDEASSRTLYSVEEGIATPLLSGPNRQFSEFVSFRDSIYFMTGSLPISQSPNQADQILAELWRTDGTPAGTEKVANLLSFFAPELTRLVPGEDKLLLQVIENIASAQVSVFYVYDALNNELGLLGEGFSQLVLITPEDIDNTANTAAYHNNAFYLTGKEEPSDDNTIYRVDETTFAITRIELPNPLQAAFFIDDPVDYVSFLPVGEELLFAAENVEYGNLNGPWLYRIEGEDGLDIGDVMPPVDIRNTSTSSNFPGITVQDTLYQLTRDVNNEVTLQRYYSGISAPEAMVNLGQLGVMEDLPSFPENTPTYIEVSEEFIFVIDQTNRELFRISRANPESFDRITVGDLPDHGSVADPQIEVLSDASYFVNTTVDSLEGVGLYRWPHTEASPELIGGYSTSNLFGLNNQQNIGRPTSWAYDSIAGRLLLGNDSLFLYDPATEVGIALTPTLPGFNRFFSTQVGNTMVFRSFNTDNFDQQPLLIVSGTDIKLPTLQTDLPILNDTNYAVRSLIRITPDTLVLRIAILAENGERSFFPAIGTLAGDTLFLNRISNFDLNSRAFIQSIGGNRVCFRVPSLTSDTTAFYSVGADGNFLGSVILPNGFPVARATTATGIYFEVVDEFLQNRFQFVPYGMPEAMQNIAIDRAVPASGNRFNYYTLGGRLLFTVDSDSLGREWYVAEPGTNEATALLDINQGSGSGVFATTATQIGDQLFFAANDGISGNELWVTDGTSAGTVQVADINPGTLSSNPSDILLNEGTIFFTANGPDGYELYRMSPDDQTPELIIDLHPEGDGHPYGFQADSEHFYFIGRNGSEENFEIFQIAYELVPTDTKATKTPAKVFPNPARNVPITVVAPTGESITRIQVFNTTGQLLSEIADQGERANLDLSSFPAGTYWVRTWYASGRFSLNAVQRIR